VWFAVHPAISHGRDEFALAAAYRRGNTGCRLFVSHWQSTSGEALMNRAKLRVMLCITLLIGLSSYSEVVGPEHMDRLPRALAQPDRVAGAELRLPSNVKVVQVHPRAFVVRQRDAEIAVRVPDHLEPEWAVWQQQVQVGDYVSLKATFHPEGYLLLRDMHVHQGRRLKIWVSVLALVLLAGILLHERGKGFVRPCPTSSPT
jgi:hypothetical protein